MPGAPKKRAHWFAPGSAYGVNFAEGAHLSHGLLGRETPENEGRAEDVLTVGASMSARRRRRLTFGARATRIACSAQTLLSDSAATHANTALVSTEGSFFLRQQHVNVISTTRE